MKHGKITGTLPMVLFSQYRIRIHLWGDLVKFVILFQRVIELLKKNLPMFSKRDLVTWMLRRTDMETCGVTSIA